MFIRALKAIVLPLVFVNVLISVVDMMSLGRASSVGWVSIVQRARLNVISKISKNIANVL